MQNYKFTFYARNVDGTKYEWSSNSPSFVEGLKHLQNSLVDIDDIEFVGRGENCPEGGYISLTAEELWDAVYRAK